MPICTYLSTTEEREGCKCEDKEINELLAEVNKHTGPRPYMVREREHEVGPFWKKRIVKSYELLYRYIPNCPEVQSINFPPIHDGPMSSINCFGISKPMILTYLMGLINGIDHGKEKE